MKSRRSIRLLFLGAISICSGFKVTQYSQVPDQQVSFYTSMLLIMLLQSSADYCKLNFLNLKTFDQEFRTGERLYLLCKSDTVWERCVFRHRLVSPCPCPLSWPTFIYLTDRNRLLPRSIKISKFVNLFTLSCLLLNQTTSISSSLAHFKFVQPLPLEMAPLL